ncbi:ABC transporter ATP-binding protein [Hyphomicrobium sp. MC1]|uniref:ABC transporter ATP-binding protein n=1 Tax=Hyphomicrobium sp. (strain MC1) TaxID=717785 RepID=UPI000213EB6A|nr:ABC transporter ATP-binding protein [Hyphomicrobium sp. MC1]CCB66613.1 alkanesulfonate transport protein (ABC superfamily, atp_bind) [Hyphomicrobium sp. MC1]
MLKTQKLGKTYPGGFVALQDVSLQIGDGEIASIVGSSGCGKSTLLRLLAGLDRPSTGTVWIDGKELNSPHPAVGVIFQEPRLMPWLTVRQNVGFGLSHLRSNERRDRIDTVLERVGLLDYGQRWPRELSGGQSQRVSIARALVMQPTVLLLDEPFSALDAFTRVELQEHLLELWAGSKLTLVIVTHDIEEAVALGSRLFVLKPHPGRVATIFEVRLERPRDRISARFGEEKRKVLAALDSSLLEHRKIAPSDRVWAKSQ